MAVCGVRYGLLAGLLPALLLSLPALAAPRITEKIEYYTITGKTGEDLLYEMNRKGPRHGFLRKAIAQTRYSATPRGSFAWRDGTCRTIDSGVVLDITYIYPKPEGTLPRDLVRRWNVFQADNVRHEKEHGRIARRMASELDRTIGRFSMKDGRSCGRAAATLKRQVADIYDKYEKLQNAFDRREHRPGGEVEKSIRVLTGRRH